MTTNLYASGNVFIAGSATSVGYPTLFVQGNIYASNALTTANVWTGNLYATNNVFAANAIVTSNILTNNVYASGNVYIAGSGESDKYPTLFVQGNVYVANALTTTNVFTTNLFASSVMTTVLTAMATSYAALTTDSYIGMSTGGTVTIPLSTTVSVGKTYMIKDESGLAGVNSARRITIQMSGADLLDGQSTTIIQLNYAALTIMYTGASNRWSII